MELTEIERQSAIWQKLTQHFEARRDTLRAQLENDLPEVETAKVRGQLAVINKELLGLNKPKQQMFTGPA